MYLTEAISGCEYYKSGDLKLRVCMKRLYSDEPDEDSEEVPLCFDKIIFINTKRDEMSKAVSTLNLFGDKNKKYRI